MGRGKKSKQGRNRKQGGKGQNPGKRQERETRQKLRERREREAYENPEWKKAMMRFGAQLKLLGLRIVDMTGDGNCMFRAVCHQMQKTAHQHASFRRDCVAYMRDNPDDFAPFVVDETFDEYLRRMSKDAEWGGHLELMAFSLMLCVNIVIHQLDQPRWEIINFSPHQRAIHLSYHDGQHYSSVVPIQAGAELPLVSSAGQGAAVVSSGGGAAGNNNGNNGGGNASNNSNNNNNKNGNNGDGRGAEVTDEERMVMEATGCEDLRLARRALRDSMYNIEEAIQFAMTVIDLGGLDLYEKDEAAYVDYDTPDFEVKADFSHVRSAAEASNSNHASHAHPAAQREKQRKKRDKQYRAAPSLKKLKGDNLRAAQVMKALLQKNARTRLSNKERKALNALRKKAASYGIDEDRLDEQLAYSSKKKKNTDGNNNNSNGGKANEAHEDEETEAMDWNDNEKVDEFLANATDLGALSI